MDGLVMIRASHGDNLASVVLYGRAGGPGRVALGLQSAAALNRITPEDLRQAQAPMREWSRLVLHPVYFLWRIRMCGVFPIEFHRWQWRMYFGRDPFDSLNSLMLTCSPCRNELR